jgi:Rieske Fe-S protein
MNRRNFIRISGCALAAGLLSPGCAMNAQAPVPPASDLPVKPYNPCLLTHSQGEPWRAGTIEPRQTYFFFYPYAGTPVFLINLGRPVSPVRAAGQDNDRSPGGIGGVGPQRSIVAFSAICHHQLSRPSPKSSAINYSPEAGLVAGAKDLITCCAHNAVYDPAAGGRVVDGPGRSALTTVALRYDPADDTLRATGTAGIEVFESFFREQKRDLIQEFGPGKAREEQKDAVRVMRFKDYTAEQLMC